MRPFRQIGGASEERPGHVGHEADAPLSIVHPKNSNLTPTDQAYGEWQFAYEYFNERLFEGRLPNCLITLTRKAHTLGYFSPERFESTRNAFAHEISLNPQYLQSVGDFNALSTLVHEQGHLFRHEFGPRNKGGAAGSRGYHDRAWARVMLAVGLVPSNTAKPGGAQTGHSMSHYVEPGGLFDVACRELLISGFAISWRDSSRLADATDGIDKPAPKGGRATRSKANRAKFRCPTCGLNAWAKPAAKLGCVSCSTSMLAAV